MEKEIEILQRIKGILGQKEIESDIRVKIEEQII